MPNIKCTSTTEKNNSTYSMYTTSVVKRISNAVKGAHYYRTTKANGKPKLSCESLPTGSDGFI